MATLISEAACRPAALITAMVLLGVGIDRLVGRKVSELFLETRGDASEYDDLECLCFLSASSRVLLGTLISLGAGRMARSACTSLGIEGFEVLPDPLERTALGRTELQASSDPVTFVRLVEKRGGGATGA